MNDTPRKTLSPAIPSEGLQTALEQSAAFTQAFGQSVLTPEILLYTFLRNPDTGAHRLLHMLVGDLGFDWAELETQAKTAAQNNSEPDVAFDLLPAAGAPSVPLGEGVIGLIHEGYTLAQSRNETRCGSEHALVFMGASPAGVGRLLARFGITSAEVSARLPDPAVAGSSLTRDHVALSRAEEGAPAPLYPREALLRDLLDLLSIVRAGNVILVGPTGAGKRALAYTLAERLAEQETHPRFKSLIEISEQSLLDNPLAAMRAGLRAARDGILFVPHIDRFFGGHRAEFPPQAGAELQKAFFDPRVAVLGTATHQRYAERLEDEFAVTQNSRTLDVQPTDLRETNAILRTLHPLFEENYLLNVDPDCLPDVAHLAARYLVNTALPGAAVGLLHRACAGAVGTLNARGVSDTIARMTGVPVAGPEADERERYAQMADHLHQHIIGQDEAIQALSRAVGAARLGLKDPRRPVGSFLFTGPTGVGKSETARALARFMFGSEEALITLDMSEYMDKSSVNRLIGSPPGYIGSGEGGQLTNAVKQRPYSVILFDEVEKADTRVFDLLLQILDEGRLTSGRGEVVSFSECVILMTGNIAQSGNRADVETALNACFRPEFLNRLDGIIPFHPLNTEQMGQVLRLLLSEEANLLARRGVSLRVDDEVVNWLLSRNDHPEWGARPLRRILQEYIRAPLVDFLLRQTVPARISASITIADGTPAFDFEEEYP